MTGDEMIGRERLLHDTVEKAVEAVYAMIWMDSPFTMAESRLMWLQVISKMLESVAIDNQQNVVKEHLGL